MKIITLFFVLLVSTFNISAQCVPDTSITHNVAGMYPDKVVGLPHASVGQPYSTTIQLKVLVDTVYLGFTVPIDSINIDNVTGLPSGFTFSCTPVNCSFPGGSDACILLQGTAPTSQMIGTYPIVVEVTAYGVFLGTPTNLPANVTGYSIVIDTTTGINDIHSVSFTVGQNNPNPAHAYTTIPVNLTRNEEVIVSVSNLIGKKVVERTYNLQRGKNNINVDVHGFQPGIYLYTVTVGRNNTTRRMIVSAE